MGLCTGGDTPRDKYSFETLVLAVCVSLEIPASEVARIVGLVLGRCSTSSSIATGACLTRDVFLRCGPRMRDDWGNDPVAVIVVAAEPYRKMRER